MAETELPPHSTTDDLASFLNVSRRTLEWWRREGTGPGYVRMPNGQIRYPSSRVLDWLDEHARVEIEPTARRGLSKPAPRRNAS